MYLQASHPVNALRSFPWRNEKETHRAQTCQLASLPFHLPLWTRSRYSVWCARMFLRSVAASITWVLRPFSDERRQPVPLSRLSHRFSFPSACYKYAHAWVALVQVDLLVLHWVQRCICVCGALPQFCWFHQRLYAYIMYATYLSRT